MSRCDKYLEMISLYVDGELDEDSAAQLREHLEECQECRKYYEAFSIISQNIEETQAPEGFASEVMGALRESGGRQAVGAASGNNARKRKLTRSTVGRFAALAACLALVVAAGVKVAFPGAESNASGGDPVQFAATGACGDEDGVSDRAAEEHISGAEVQLVPESASSDYSGSIDAITVSDGETVTRIVDEAEIETLAAILEYGEEAGGLPEAQADYVLEIESEEGTVELMVYDVDGLLLCVDGDGEAYIASGSAEDLASELPWSSIEPSDEGSGDTYSAEGEG